MDLNKFQKEMGILPLPVRFYKKTGQKTIQNFNIPELCGVYFLWSKIELLYIGKSKNLRKRIAQHFSNGFLNLHMVNPEEIDKVSIIFTKDEYDAARLEDKLIYLLPTKWNRFPFYKTEYYYDWRNKTGIFSESISKDKLNNIEPDVKIK